MEWKENGEYLIVLDVYLFLKLLEIESEENQVNAEEEEEAGE